MDMIAMEVALSIAGRESAEQCIDNIQRRTQTNTVTKNLLPIKMQDSYVPREILHLGIQKDMPWSEESKIRENNIKRYTKDLYTRLGIVINCEYDRDNYSVILPEGWNIKRTDHPMWNHLYDDKGNKRAEIFSKAFDESFIRFDTRYYLTREDDEESKTCKFFIKDHITDKDSGIMEPVITNMIDDYGNNWVYQSKVRDSLKEQMELKMPGIFTDVSLYWND